VDTDKGRRIAGPQLWSVAVCCDYGTVGTWPAFSWASRAALSPASWVAFSLEWKVPGAGAVPVPGVVVDGVEALGLAAVVAVVAAWVTMNPPAKAPVIRPSAVAATAARRPFLPNMGALYGGGGGGGISVLSMPLSMVEGPLLVWCFDVGGRLEEGWHGGMAQGCRFMAVLRDLADDAMLVIARADSLSVS
jgi:hypothetical protein